MTKTYTLEGLDCAHCAQKIECAVAALPGVDAVTVNFATSTLRVTADTDLEAVIGKTITAIESEVKVQSQRKTTERHTFDRVMLARLTSGLVLFIAALLLQSSVAENGVVRLLLFAPAYVVLGFDVLLKAVRGLFSKRVFSEDFLMALATVGALALGEYSEALAVMLFYQVGELFQASAVRRSKKSIAQLMAIRPDIAHVLQGEALVDVAPEAVAVGSHILVKPGELVPLDGIVVSTGAGDGLAQLDTASLTGESEPRDVAKGDAVLSGCVNLNCVLTLEVTALYGQSTVAKILDLVENASSKKARAESFISAFARVYTPIVVLLAALVAVVPPLLMGGDWSVYVQRSLIFLVISCPCALVVSVPLSFFGAIGRASRQGILVKGGQYLDALNRLDTVVFDKTGTLTRGQFSVVGLTTIEGVAQDELLRLAAYAEAFSSHPIAHSIRAAYAQPIDHALAVETIEVAGKGVSVKVNDLTIHAGNAEWMLSQGIDVPEVLGNATIVYVARNHTYIGSIAIADTVKPDSASTVAALKAKGVRRIAMLTGDRAAVAQPIAESLGIQEVYSDLLPDGKVSQVERLYAEKPRKTVLAFVGDGINDAPVLAGADLGIAMGGVGSDAAIEAADMVLMTDETSKLVEAMDIARKTRRIVWQNIAFALAVKAAVMALGALGMATMWAAVFADVGVSVLAVLNAMRTLRA